MAQRDKNRMRGLAFIAGVKFALPPIEKLKRPQGVGNLVAEVIGPAAVGVDIVEMLMKRFGKEPGNNIKILVVMRGEPARVLLRSGGRAPRLGHVAHDFEFAWKKHQKSNSSFRLE